MNMRHLKMHSGTYATSLKMCTTIEAAFSSQLQISGSVRSGGCLKYHCLTICPLSGVQSNFLSKPLSAEWFIPCCCIFRWSE